MEGHKDEIVSIGEDGGYKTKEGDMIKMRGKEAPRRKQTKKNT